MFSCIIFLVILARVYNIEKYFSFLYTSYSVCQYMHYFCCLEIPLLPDNKLEMFLHVLIYKM